VYGDEQNPDPDKSHRTNRLLAVTVCAFVLMVLLLAFFAR
jgi:hypothetical protein